MDPRAAELIRTLTLRPHPEGGHFAEVFKKGRADAALAASVFHYAEHAVAELKRHLEDRGIPVRC
jgi:imidazole glycerol phosphate synthase subunit HisF